MYEHESSHEARHSFHNGIPFRILQYEEEDLCKNEVYEHKFHNDEDSSLALTYTPHPLLEYVLAEMHPFHSEPSDQK